MEIEPLIISKDIVVVTQQVDGAFFKIFGNEKGEFSIQTSEIAVLLDTLRRIELSNTKE